jgi:hypothetical protein
VDSIENKAVLPAKNSESFSDLLFNFIRRAERKGFLGIAAAPCLAPRTYVSVDTIQIQTISIQAV